MSFEEGDALSPAWTRELTRTE